MICLRFFHNKQGLQRWAYKALPSGMKLSYCALFRSFRLEI
jgi:hypothetical protein